MKTLHYQDIAMAKYYPSHPEYRLFLSRGLPESFIALKQYGLHIVFKYGRNKCILSSMYVKFMDIKSINIEVDKMLALYYRFVTLKIEREGEKCEITFAIGNDMTILDKIRLYYLGEMIGY